MMVLYLVTLITGGLLVVASAFLGDADVDADIDADLDLDADADIDADADAEADACYAAADLVQAWLPYGSMRFWTFFAAFFGLTGTLLTLLGLLNSTLWVAIVASLVGYVTGWGMTRVIRSLKQKSADGSVRESDYLGACGTVLLPLSGGQTGKIRLELRGRAVDLLACTTRDAMLRPGEPVFVYDVRDDGVLQVVAADEALPPTGDEPLQLYS